MPEPARNEHTTVTALRIAITLLAIAAALDMLISAGLPGTY